MVRFWSTDQNGLFQSLPNWQRTYQKDGVISHKYDTILCLELIYLVLVQSLMSKALTMLQYYAFV